MKRILSFLLVVGLLITLVPTETYAYEKHEKCTVSAALRFRKNPSLTSKVLGIIYPGEIIYDCGFDANIEANNGEFTLIERPSTQQMGYGWEDYLVPVK